MTEKMCENFALNSLHEVWVIDIDSLSLHWLKITERIEYKLLLQSRHNHPTSLYSPPHLCSTSSQHSLFISGYPRSATTITLATHKWSLLRVRLTLSLESTSSSFRQPRFSPPLSLSSINQS